MRSMNKRKQYVELDIPFLLDAFCLLDPTHLYFFIDFVFISEPLKLYTLCVENLSPPDFSLENNFVLHDEIKFILLTDALVHHSVEVNAYKITKLS